MQECVDATGAIWHCPGCGEKLIPGWDGWLWHCKKCVETYVVDVVNAATQMRGEK
jgi:predicted RNA-binding Zn-ribbon protein involved in translation (DUF1610 family)